MPDYTGCPQLIACFKFIDHTLVFLGAGNEQTCCDIPTACMSQEWADRRGPPPIVPSPCELWYGDIVLLDATRTWMGCDLQGGNPILACLVYCNIFVPFYLLMCGLLLVTSEMRLLICDESRSFRYKPITCYVCVLAPFASRLTPWWEGDCTIKIISYTARLP